jgi:uncharacterized protein
VIARLGRSRPLFFFFLLGGILFLSLSLFADIVIPRSPTRWATDTAGFLSPATVSFLDSELASYERRTGHQVLVYVGKTTGGYPIEEFAVKAFEAWKVGRKGLDDGLVLFIMAEDRKIRIEVGYGLEDVVPDAVAFEVINNILLPGIRSGNQDEAIKRAVAALEEFISGPAPESRPEERPTAARHQDKGKSIVSLIFIGVAGVFFLILFITNPGLAFWLLLSILSGGRGGGLGRGGGSWGGGGFSGGGGRSGGGGASGGW